MKKKDARDADYKAYCLARDLEVSMCLPKSSRPLTDLVDEAEERYRAIEEVSRQIATAKMRLAQKEQEANRLIAELHEEKQPTPTSKEPWMVNWIKDHAPKVYAACEQAYQKAHAVMNERRRRLERKAQQLFDTLDEQETQDDYKEY